MQFLRHPDIATIIEDWIASPQTPYVVVGIYTQGLKKLSFNSKNNPQVLFPCWRMQRPWLSKSPFGPRFPSRNEGYLFLVVKTRQFSTCSLTGAFCSFVSWRNTFEKRRRNWRSLDESTKTSSSPSFPSVWSGSEDPRSLRTFRCTAGPGVNAKGRSLNRLTPVGIPEGTCVRWFLVFFCVKEKQH